LSDERVRQRLQDIVDDARELQTHLEGMDRDAFCRDLGAQRIAERLLEIAGGAATHVPDDASDQIDADWAGLRRMRVLLAHAYHRVDPQQLWAAATRDLPRLADAVQAYLDD
jgi:uncharacterized protein with HEPN domain